MGFLFMPATIWPLESELGLLAHSPWPHPCLPSTHFKDFAVLISPSDKEHGSSFTWLDWINLRMSFLTTAIPLIMWTRLLSSFNIIYFYFVPAYSCCFFLLSTFSSKTKKNLRKLPVLSFDINHWRIFSFYFSCLQHSMFISLAAAKP